MSDPSPSGDVYRARIAQFTRAAAPLGSTFNRIANARLMVAGCAVGCAFARVYWPHGPTAAALWLTGALGSAAWFVVLLVDHANVHQKIERGEGLRRINAHALARLERDWSALPFPEAPAGAQASMLSADLDLFGKGSLFHLIGTTGTPQGRHTLAGWLVAPPPDVAGTLPARQQAVAELAGELDLRQELELAAAGFPATARTGDDPFLSWAATEPWLLPRTSLIWVSRLVPVLMLISLILFFEQRIDVTPAVLLLGVRWGVTWRYGGGVRRRLDQVASKHTRLRPYGDLFARLAKWRPAAPLLNELCGRLQGAARGIESLQTLVGLAAIRVTPANPVAQWFFMWDFHTLFLMERWQQRHGAQVRAWFTALGEVEALAALSTLAFDEPTWVFPNFTDEPQVAARALGHPLLAAKARVTNDVNLGPPGSVLLVTGSNMSGKSTLLRTIGINLVLAQAGAPVCAAELRLPRAVALATSLRVEDSLQEGVSFFMAELHRLAAVVARADDVGARPGGPVLVYLLDEILRGTNTQERQIIVGKVVAHLLRCRAVGAVTTHDLSLAETPSLAGACRAVHFTEFFEDRGDGALMRFDYKMRPGLATTTNALKLLRSIGLDL